MKQNNFFSSKRLTGMAVLLALVIVLQSVGGSIAIGAVQLNFTLIPIVLGAIMYGAWVGGFLGLACGIVVLIQVIMGLVPFYTIIWTNTPVIAALTCVVKTTVAGLVSGWLFTLLKKKNQHVAVFVASGVVPVINTGLFIVGCLLMNKSITAFQQSIGETSSNVLVFILIFLVTFNFFIEFAINLLLSPALYRVINIVDGKYSVGKRIYDEEDELEGTVEISDKEKKDDDLY